MMRIVAVSSDQRGMDRFCGALIYRLQESQKFRDSHPGLRDDGT
jgi:hypothetical protein